MAEAATINIAGRKLPVTTVAIIGGVGLFALSMLRGNGAAQVDDSGLVREEVAQALSEQQERTEGLLQSFADWVSEKLEAKSESDPVAPVQIAAAPITQERERKSKPKPEAVAPSNYVISSVSTPSTPPAPTFTIPTSGQASSNLGEGIIAPSPLVTYQPLISYQPAALVTYQPKPPSVSGGVAGATNTSQSNRRPNTPPLKDTRKVSNLGSSPSRYGQLDPD